MTSRKSCIRFLLVTLLNMVYDVAIFSYNYLKSADKDVVTYWSLLLRLLSTVSDSCTNFLHILVFLTALLH